MAHSVAWGMWGNYHDSGDALGRALFLTLQTK